MTTRCLLTAVIAVTLVLPLTGGCKDDKKQTVRLAGSTSVQPFAEMLGQEFSKTHPDIHVQVNAGGSTVGITSLVDGVADIGDCSRDLTADEKARNLFTPIVIARDGLAIVVNKDNPVNGLTLEQARKLFTGQTANWNQVGGKDQPVRVVVREEASGTREAFMHLVMKDAHVSEKALVQDSNGTVKELVKSDPAAVGYMSLGLVGTEVKAVAMDGVQPTHAEVLAGRYNLVRPFLFVVRKDKPLRPEARAFIDFVLSAPSQQMLEKEGLVRVGEQISTEQKAPTAPGK